MDGASMKREKNQAKGIALLDGQWPIFQAPVGSLASPELVAAVSNAGGVGNLACTWSSVERLSEIFRTVRSLTDKKFGANFVLDFPIEEQLAATLDQGVSIISFFWGDGGQYVQRVKSAGATAIQVVGSVDEAKRAADAGFELIVAQGYEAGGHVRGACGTMALVPQAVDAVAPIPVLAAGGIADQRGVRASLALGAKGVWVGTRFLASAETDIHPVYQDRILDADADEAVWSNVFDIGWPNAPVRTILNSTMRLVSSESIERRPPRPGEGEVVAYRTSGQAIPRYHYAAPSRGVSGDIEAMALYAGSGVGLVRSVQPAEEIVQELASGLSAAAPARFES
jgi:NAD(P)H-dependent flavin oxidoreductase YrpB (nitropropane dioxygenase family)